MNVVGHVMIKVAKFCMITCNRGFGWSCCVNLRICLSLVHAYENPIMQSQNYTSSYVAIAPSYILETENYGIS